MQLNHANLSPFAHDCHEPPRCGQEFCAGCRFVREQLARELVKSLDLKPDYADYELFQIGLEETGLIPA
jgi:hypothetical protein